MKTEEDEAFDDMARRQGMWGGGFNAKRQAAMDKINSHFDEAYKKMHEDRAMYGTSWSKDGERIDPASVYLEQPAQEQEEDWGALAEKQLASIKRDTQASFEDAMVRATHKVMAECEAQPAQEPVEEWPGQSNIESQHNACQHRGYCKQLKAQLPLPAQPAQEPVAWGFRSADGAIYDCISPKTHDECEGSYTVPLYTALPLPAQPAQESEILTIVYQSGYHDGKKKRPWVGLTDEDLLQIRETVQVVEGRSLLQSLTKAIEQALKEKNT